jgi:hypothetical protein
VCLLPATIVQGLFSGSFGLWRRRSVPSMTSRGSGPEGGCLWAKRLGSRSGRTPRSSRAACKTGSSRWIQ